MPTSRKTRSALGNHEVDDLTKGFTSMSLSTLPSYGTGLAYHPSMLDHNCPWDQRHVECQQRLELPLQRLFESGLFKKCTAFQGHLANDVELGLVHTQEYIDLVRSTVIAEDKDLEHLARKFDSVYFNESTYKSASMAVGCCIDLVRAICTNKCRNGFALIRPPGHHAETDRACGFSVFNNVAIAAKYAQNKMGVKRVLIVDYDVHHGQATQNIFYDDPSVLYFSMHRYEHGKYWPHLAESNTEFTGNGFNINFPFNKTDLKDVDCLTAFYEVLMPAAFQFNPELVIVSAGFDAAAGDPKGELGFSAAVYGHMTRMLSCLARGRIMLALEGGYNPEMVADCVESCVEALLDEPPRKMKVEGSPHSTVCDTVLDCASVLNNRWTCMNYYCPSQNSLVSDWPIHEHKILYNPEPKCEGTTCGRSHCTPSKVRGRLASNPHCLMQPNKTALVFNDEMELHSAGIYHPECPQRHKHIVQRIKASDLISKCNVVQSREATDDEILLVHDERYMNRMKWSMSLSPKELNNLVVEFKGDVFVNNSSAHCASIAVGSVLELVDAVLNNVSPNGLAVVRPPGHHAQRDCAMGFCLYNNVAIAAKYAQQMHGLNRVLIVDWDIHHGNGVQDMFYHDPSVLYISLHRFDGGTFYPLNSDSDMKYTGEGRGEGYNVNIAWNREKMGDAEYLMAFLKVVMPVALQFDPELVLVSCGFDAAQGDPLGEYHVTSAAFATMTRMLMTLANGKVILALEGGYNLQSISDAAEACLRTLIGQNAPAILIPAKISECAWETLRQVRAILQPHWPIYQGLQRRLSPKSNAALSKTTPVKTRNANKLSVTASGKVNLTKSCPPKLKSSKTNKIRQASGSTVTNKPAQSEASSENTASSSSTSSSEINPVNELLLLPEGVIPDACGLYAVAPLSDCPHLCQVTSPPEAIMNIASPCLKCSNVGENWICLTCYQVHCGRYVQSHAVNHGLSENHSIALSFADLSVWCYVCDNYVHNNTLLSAKAMAHFAKCGVHMPMPNSTHSS